MIHVIGQQQLVRFEKTNPGDLVAFTYDGEGAIGIVLALNEDRAPLIGVLVSNSGQPRLLRENAESLCVTRGVSWAIEALNTSLVAPGPVDVLRRAGLLALTSRGWLMNFASSQIDPFGRFNWEWWDLTRLKPTETSLSRAVLYDTWRIWAPSEERDRVGAEPTIDFRAKAPPIG